MSTELVERARIIKLKLSGLRDPVIANLLPGAPRVSQEACDFIDELVRALVSPAAPQETPQ